ncbi:MAG: retroviral-like aspartic protease family protein [Acidobacteriota bacterium]|nr:retroviral-like aspartic protease family protein [Acidobacteriota bacterium]
MSKQLAILLISLACLVFAACTVPVPSGFTEPAAASGGEVGFDLAGPGGAAIVVPVQINNEGPFNFVVDTGATLTCVDQEIAKRLNLPEQRGVAGIGASIKSQGNMQLLKVDSLQVGTAKATNMTACTVDLQHIRAIGLEAQGLLGLNFLKSYRVTIDFQSKVLQLQSPAP